MKEGNLILVAQRPPKAGWYRAVYYDNRQFAAYRYFDGTRWLRGDCPRFFQGDYADFGSHFGDRWGFK